MTIWAALCMPNLPACLPATASAASDCESSSVHERSARYIHVIGSLHIHGFVTLSLSLGCVTTLVQSVSPQTVCIQVCLTYEISMSGCLTSGL